MSKKERLDDLYKKLEEETSSHGMDIVSEIVVLEIEEKENPEQYSNRRQKEVFGISDEEVEVEERKRNYWRGFVVASIIFGIIIIMQHIVIMNQ